MKYTIFAAAVILVLLTLSPNVKQPHRVSSLPNPSPQGDPAEYSANRVEVYPSTDDTSSVSVTPRTLHGRSVTEYVRFFQDEYGYTACAELHSRFVGLYRNFKESITVGDKTKEKRVQGVITFFRLMEERMRCQPRYKYNPWET